MHPIRLVFLLLRLGIFWGKVDQHSLCVFGVGTIFGVGLKGTQQDNHNFGFHPVDHVVCVDFNVDLFVGNQKTVWSIQCLLLQVFVKVLGVPPRGNQQVFT